MNNKEFFLSIEELEREKGIKQDLLIETLKNALVSAYKKHTGTSSDVMIDMNPEKKTVKFFAVKTVVEEVTDPEKEISLEEAREIKKSYKVGDEVKNRIRSQRIRKNCRSDRKAGCVPETQGSGKG